MEAVYNPIKDAAFLKQIGAKWSEDIVIDEKVIGSIYELKDATNEATYELTWYCEDLKQFFGIEKL